MSDTLDKTYYELPEVIQYIIADYLPTAALAELKAPDTDLIDSHQSFFKPLVDVRTFLDAVANGEHHIVKTMLKNNIDLIIKKGAVIDFSKRGFDQISGFEYALWALDKHMWTTIIECIPKNEAGKKILEQLAVQYDKVRTQGITYTLKGEVITETHFDFQNTIIKELQMQIDSINALGDKNVIAKQWREGVGSAQRLLPVHVVNEYCEATAFNPVPDFNSYPGSLKQFYNWTTDKDESWFNEDSKLGVDFAISKGWRGQSGDRACALGDEVGPGGVGDLVAVMALCKVRTNDFNNLRSQLEEKPKIDNNQPLTLHSD